VPYVQSGVSRMYYLSPGARESRGVTSFRAEAIRFESLWFRSIERSDLMVVCYPKRWMTLPFIVQGGLLYWGAKGVRIERENPRSRRSGSSASSVGFAHSVSWSLLMTIVQVLCRGASVLSCSCASCSIVRRSWGC
jgi:hypothetical protein